MLTRGSRLSNRGRLLYVLIQPFFEVTVHSRVLYIVAVYNDDRSGMVTIITPFDAPDMLEGGPGNVLASALTPVWPYCRLGTGTDLALVPARHQYQLGKAWPRQ